MDKIAKKHIAGIMLPHVSSLSAEEAENCGLRAYFMQRSVAKKQLHTKALARKILDGEIDSDEARQFRK